ncbi:MAG: pilus assembly protein [Acidobacteria bacterium]|nr:pilus assembly protein [Acidobacteriota bacterium]
MRRSRGNSGQATVEFALLYAGVIVPLTFALIFTSEMLWIWHSAVEFTRDGARYAATHCWQPGADNVLTYMRTHVPRMMDMDQFQSGAAEITVEYFARDPDTGQLTEFTCDSGECSTNCVPDTVSISITNYEFRRFVNFLGLPPVGIPTFKTSMPIESAGCDPEQGTCLP